jgi:hypothetical protein
VQVVGITEHLRRHHGIMVSTGEGASTVIPCLSFPTERPRRRSHHLQRDHQADYGVRGTLELDLTRKPALLQVVLAGCAEAAAAARAMSAPLCVRGWRPPTVAKWHLPSVLPGVMLASLGIVDATRKQEHSAQKLRRRCVRVSAPLYVRVWRPPNAQLPARAATHSCRRRQAALRQR